MSTEDLYLSITPFTLANIPSEEQLLKAGRQIIEQSKGWKKGKSYVKHTVQITSRPKGPKDGAGWYARYSTHVKTAGSFDEFWKGLGENKAENEKEFIPELKRIKLVKQISPTQSIWTLYYQFSPPVSPRVFTVLQVTQLEETPVAREGYIVSIPIDLSGDSELAAMEEHGVKGRYVSIEFIKELGDGGVEWRMATSSTPGGKIPSFVAEISMPGSISADVPHFLQWLEQRRNSTPAVADVATTLRDLPSS